jgi:hypothetical protein
MTDEPQRLTADQLQALKFAAHRQLARWANKPELQPRTRARRTALAHAVRTLEHKTLTDGCDLHPTTDR